MNSGGGISYRAFFLGSMWTLFCVAVSKATSTLRSFVDVLSNDQRSVSAFNGTVPMLGSYYALQTQTVHRFRRKPKKAKPNVLFYPITQEKVRFPDHLVENYRQIRKTDEKGFATFPDFLFFTSQQ